MKRSFAHELLRHGSAGALAAATVAIGDAGWAAWYGEPLPLRAALAVIALELLLLLGPGLIKGAVVGVLAIPVMRGVRRVGPRITAAAGGLALAAAVAFLLLRDREIDWDTVDRRLTLIPLAVLVFLAAHRLGDRARWVLIGGLALASGAHWATSDEVQVVALDRLSSASRLGAIGLEHFGHISDGDDDGAPRWLCGDVCDCDDRDVTRYPSAEEVAGDGIDQDCDGEDLSSDEGDAIASLFAATPPADAGTRLAADAPHPRPDILILTIDTLRADHLGVYGYGRDTTPNIDRWAREQAVVFAQARSGGPSTRFSIPSMMVGRHFTEIARTRGEWPTIQNSELLFAERLAELGYASAAFHSIRYLRPFFGVNQGFEHWSCDCLDVRGPPLFMTCSDFITDEALAWLDAHGKNETRPMLLWAYYGDPHSRYVRHEGTPEFGPEYRDLYDHEIRFTDEHVGRLLAGIASRRPGRELVVILHSDHGEGLDADVDHGSLYHSANLHDELVHVPFIISGPGLPAHAVSESVSLVDFVPTMLELLGEPIDPALRGTSLVPWLQDRATAPHPPVMFEKHRALDDAQHGMVAWPYKVIKTMPSGRIDIFDLAADPGERVDVTGKLDKATRKRLTGALGYWHREIREPFDDGRRH